MPKKVQEKEIKPEIKEEAPDAKRRDVVLREVKREDNQVKILEEPLRLNLNAKQSKEIITKIKSLIEVYKADRQTEEAQWEKRRNRYEGILPDKSFPWANSANFDVGLITEKVDGLECRTRKVLFPAPMWNFIPTEGTDVDTCHKKENFVDFIAKIKMALKKVLSDVTHDAILLGTSLLSLVWDVDTERVRDVSRYDGKEGLKQFLKTYEDANTRYPNIVKRLGNGENILLVEEYDCEMYNAPRAEWLEIERVYFDKNISDFNKQPLIAIEDQFSGSSIRGEQQNGFFENVDELEEKNEKDDFLSKDFKVWKCIYKVDIKKIRKNYEGANVKVRCLFVFEDGSEIMLRAVWYPYKHARSFIIPFYIQPKPGSAYGYGYGEKLKGMHGVSNTVFNQTLDVVTRNNAQEYKLLETSSLDPGSDKGYPGKVWRVGAMDEIDILKKSSADALSLPLQAIAQDIADRLSGVTKATAGLETKLDPRASGRKTALLLGEANVKLGHYIENLQMSMQEVGFQISQLYSQFGSEEEQFRILGQGKEAFENPQKVSREEIMLRGDYVPSGDTLHINKELEREMVMMLFEILEPYLKLFPEQTYEMLSAIIASSTHWDKFRDKVLPNKKEFANRSMEEERKAMRAAAMEAIKKGEVDITKLLPPELLMRAAGGGGEEGIGESAPPEGEGGEEEVIPEEEMV